MAKLEILQNELLRNHSYLESGQAVQHAYIFHILPAQSTTLDH
jgi:hypothetical protein